MTPRLLALPALGSALACYEGGDPAGPPLLLLPGNSLSAASTYGALWADPALAGFRLLALDWPGCGASPWVSPAQHGLYGLRGLRRVLRAAGAALPLAGALVVAHSLAGHLLLDVLADLPPLRGALLVGTPPLADAASLGAAFRPDPRAAGLFGAALTPAALADLLALLLHPAHHAAHAPALAAALRQSDPAFRTALSADIAAGHLVDEVAVLRDTRLPLALALGAADGLIDAAYFAGLPAAPARWGSALTLLAGAGHLPMLETPTAFGALLLAFAAATAPPPAGHEMSVIDISASATLA